MAFDIIIGRTKVDMGKLGKEAAVFIGRLYVKMGRTTSLANNIFMDVARTHAVMVCGKRGSGKSYTLGNIAEGMASLPENVAKNLAVLIFDTMGIYWTMKFPNEKEIDLLDSWKIKPKGLDVKIFTPKGKFDEYKEKKIPTDFNFSIKPSELTAGDWCGVFKIETTSEIGILITRIIDELEGINFSIEDIIKKIRIDKKSGEHIKQAAENMFLGADKWGLFDKEGTTIDELFEGGKTSILDVSCYEGSTSGDIKALVIGIVSRKIIQHRMSARKNEELYDIKEGTRMFSAKKQHRDLPLVWIMIDEAHEFLPRVGKTPASDALVQILREGRQPGVSLILATQQPGQIHLDAMTQSDLVISHRLTAKADIDALGWMMQTYLGGDIMRYINDLPSEKGSAIILDDNSERIYPIRARPRFTWHGGEAPVAYKKQEKAGNIDNIEKELDKLLSK